MIRKYSLAGFPSPPPPPKKKIIRGIAPKFRPMSIVAKQSPISATAEHLWHDVRPICLCCMVDFAGVNTVKKLTVFCVSVPDLPNFCGLCTLADQTLFGGILHNSGHILHRVYSRPYRLSCGVLPQCLIHSVHFCRVERCELNRRQSTGILNSLNNTIQYDKL